MIIKILFLTLLIAFISVKSSATECICPDSIGAEAGSKPLAILKSQNELNSIIVCGYLDKQIEPNSVMASEFQVFRCDTKESLLTFDALQNCSIKVNGTELVITELKTCPFGQSWQWIDVPYKKTVIKIIPQNKYEIKESMILTPPQLSNETIKKGLNYLESFRNKKDIGPETQGKLIGIALAIALNGNKQGQKYLGEMGEWEDIRVSASGSEVYYDAIDVYNSYSDATEKVPHINEKIPKNL